MAAHCDLTSTTAEVLGRCSRQVREQQARAHVESLQLLSRYLGMFGASIRVIGEAFDHVKIVASDQQNTCWSEQRPLSSDTQCCI